MHTHLLAGSPVNNKQTLMSRLVSSHRAELQMMINGSPYLKLNISLPSWLYNSNNNDQMNAQPEERCKRSITQCLNSPAHQTKYSLNLHQFVYKSVPLIQTSYHKARIILLGEGEDCSIDNLVLFLDWDAVWDDISDNRVYPTSPYHSYLTQLWE